MMSARELGKRLVAEIEEERFDEFLFTLRSINDSRASARLGINEIDSLLDLFLNPPKATLEERSNQHHLARDVHATPKRQPPPFIELSSPASGEGKRHLLYYITAIAVLPSHIQSVSVGGQDGAVVIMDNDNRFSIPRLAEVMRCHLLKILPNANSSSVPGTDHGLEDNLSRAIESALSHVHIFRPQSMASLIATVTNLHNYLFDAQAHYSIHRRIHSIILGSASAFYWQDRCDMDTASALTAASGLISSKRPRSEYVRLANSLRDVSVEFSCPVVYTTWATSTVQPGSSAIRPSLPNPWASLPTLRLVIQRRPVRKLPGAISAEEALRDRSDRNAAVAEGWFDVFVNSYDSEEWADSVRLGLKKLGGGFAMRIVSDGVSIDNNGN